MDVPDIIIMLFYPESLPQSRWPFWCEAHFQTVALNGIYYKFTTAESLEKKNDSSSEGLLFSLKVPETITHFNKLHHFQCMLRDLYQVVGKGLQQKLGCILFQFPKNFHYNEQHLNSTMEENIEVIIYFNNDKDAAATPNATYLQNYLNRKHERK